MKYINLKTYEKQSEIYKLWNKNYGFIFPISNELFERNLNNALYDASFVACDDEDNLLGFIICKTYEGEFKITSYNESAWISLILVDRNHRKRGIGSKLLELALDCITKLQKKRVCLGTDICNYFPGLPIDMKNSTDWFTNRGFTKTYSTFDLIKRLDETSIKKLPIKNESIEYRVATIDDKNNLLEFIHKNWPTRWEKEAIDYFANGGSGKEYVIGIDNGTICAFAKIGYPDTNINLISYSLTWRNKFKALGGIGPLGVDISYRGKNIGYDIVAFANNTLIDYGVNTIIIDWTGLLDFYRLMGFEVFKSYLHVTKEII